MSVPPPPKRRRLNPDESSDPIASGATSSIRRCDAEIRSSLTAQHADLERFADVLVCAQGERASEEFACIAALLASASRPLSAMLFGQMRAVVPACGEVLPVPNRLTCFVAMLQRELRSQSALEEKVMVYHSGASTSHWANAGECQPMPANANGKRPASARECHH